jgi:glycosyltransferase involved in cell wall biosynthesis
MENKTQTHRCDSEPLVSVIIPTYNCASYIPKSIRSVLDQSYKNVEIIVVDDGSTDNTKVIIKKFASWVRYFHQENQGVSVARNTGINLAGGDLIVFLDADDFFLPGKLAQQTAVFKEKPELDMVHSGMKVIDEDGDVISNFLWYMAFPVLTAETFFLYKPLQLGAMMFRKNVLFRVGGFMPGLAIAEDAELMYRLCLMGCKMDWLKQETVAYRRHRQSVTQENFLKSATQAYDVMVDFFFNRALPQPIRELANPAIFNHLNWCAANFYVYNQQTLMYRFLLQSACYSTLPAPELEQTWLAMIGVVARQAGEGARLLKFLRKLRRADRWKKMVEEISLDKTRTVDHSADRGKHTLR